MIAQEVKRISGQDVELCYQCGECVSSCQAAGIGGFNPMAMMHMVQLGMEEVVEGKVFETCLHCYLCSVRCPQGLSFPEVATALSNIWTRRHGPDRIERAFLSQIREKGFVNPVRVALAASGLPSAWMLVRGLRLAKHAFESGRVNPRLLEEVRRIVRE